MIVFAAGFGTYVIFATSLMGREVESFTMFTRSTNEVFLGLIADVDWEAVSEVGDIVALVGFWTFTGVLNLIMFNILLAILMDAYTGWQYFNGKKYAELEQKKGETLDACRIYAQNAILLEEAKRKAPSLRPSPRAPRSPRAARAVWTWRRRAARRRRARRGCRTQARPASCTAPCSSSPASRCCANSSRRTRSSPS